MKPYASEEIPVGLVNKGDYVILPAPGYPFGQCHHRVMRVRTRLDGSVVLTLGVRKYRLVRMFDDMISVVIGQ